MNGAGEGVKVRVRMVGTKVPVEILRSSKGLRWKKTYRLVLPVAESPKRRILAWTAKSARPAEAAIFQNNISDTKR